MKPLVLSLPDELAEWRGTAAELAERTNVILAGVPALAEDAGSANERLVRHYVQTGVLTAPQREGREALFGLRQVVEFLAARYLLKDGWPLAKVAEIVRSTDVAGLVTLIPTERPRTPAEEVVARYRTRGTGPDSPTVSATAQRDRRDAADRGVVWSAISPYDVATRAAAEPEPELESPLARAANLSRRRVSLEENLKALGNSEGRLERSRIVRIELTPWCHVDVNARHLDEMTEDTPAILGAALTQALQEERVRKGR